MTQVHDPDDDPQGRLDIDQIEACNLQLQEYFDGFLAVGFPTGMGCDGAPAVRTAHGLTVPKLQRMVTILRMVADDMEASLRWQHGGPPPPIEGDEWKHE